MPTNTYVALNRTITASSATTVTWSSIPSGYTDLVIVASCRAVSPGSATLLRFNGDTGSNYGRIRYLGTGSGNSTVAVPNESRIAIDAPNTDWSNFIASIHNYSNTTVHKTVMNRGNSNGFISAQAATWRNTSAVTSITLTIDSGSFVDGSIFSLYGIRSEDVAAYATGGTIYQDSTHIYHVFGSSGSFVPNRSLSCEVFLVGGGAGGRYNFGGGGGGGQVRTISNVSFAATSHTVTVGAGGAGDTSGVGNPGTASSAGGNSAVGGSAGIAGGGGTPPAGGTSGNGFAGGAGINTNNNNLGGGGGGGASAVGLNAGDADFGPIGGDGIAYAIAGDTRFYGGGGNGGISGYGFNGGWGSNTLSYPRMTSRGGGGLGGGGGVFIPQIGNGLPGVINSGGGGGGGNWDNSGAGFFGGNGGSGIVVIKYAK